MLLYGVISHRDQCVFDILRHYFMFSSELQFYESGTLVDMSQSTMHGVSRYHGAPCFVYHNPCLNNSRCLANLNDFECRCPPNFTGKLCDIGTLGFSSSALCPVFFHYFAWPLHSREKLQYNGCIPTCNNFGFSALDIKELLLLLFIKTERDCARIMCCRKTPNNSCTKHEAPEHT